MAELSDTNASEGTSSEETRITLGLLNAVEANSALTQRTLARELGIALGLANTYLKRCVRKGLIKVTQVPANRYAYYLTPKGFSEKSSLTARYLTISFNFFRRARTDCATTMEQCLNRGWRRIVLAGTGDLGEIATLCATENSMELVGFFDRTSEQTSFAGVPVFNEFSDLPGFDAIIITDFKHPQDMFDFLARQIDPASIVAPDILRISRIRPTLMD